MESARYARRAVDSPRRGAPAAAAGACFPAHRGGRRLYHHRRRPRRAGDRNPRRRHSQFRCFGNLPDGTWELVTHPGYNDADLAQAHTRLLASRETEREALCAVEQIPEIELISFADLH